MSLPIVDAIIAEIGKQVDDLVLQVADSGGQDFADYKFRCGVIAGLRQAAGIAKDFETKLLQR